jgi:hypothetical protein
MARRRIVIRNYGEKCGVRVSIPYDFKNKRLCLKCCKELDEKGEGN